MSVTNYDGRLEQMAGYCKDMYINIAKFGEAYFDGVSDVYNGQLPSKYIDVLGLKSVGGKSIVWNQLVDSGTATVTTKSGNKYYTLINGTESIITGDGTAITVVDDTADMITNLTLMFGSGNEPATVSDFAKIFPAAHYAYDEGSLLSAGVTEVISKDSSNNVLQTIPIPAEIQSLEGYGWSTRGSAGVANNYIDFKRKVFIQNVAELALAVDDMNNSDSYPGWKHSGIKDIYGSGKNLQYFYLWEKAGIATGINTNGSNDIFFLMNSGLTQTQWKTQYAGVTFHFHIPLPAPIETDISEYLTDDIILKYEAGGNLIFPNQLGDDYCIPVPVGLEMIGVS